LPFNDICIECHDKHVIVEKIIPNYKEIIQMAESRIKKAEQEIQKEQDLIIWAEQQLEESEGEK
jgi:hypothetical protein